VVISSKFIGSGKEGGLVAGHNCLMFDSGDIKGAVECIGRLRNKEHRKILIENALSVVGRKYSRDQSIEAWAEKLRTVMNLAPGSVETRRLGYQKSTSRLDRVFGLRIGECVRKILGREFAHQEAGSEWPHTYARNQEDDTDFLALAGNADRRFLT